MPPSAAARAQRDATTLTQVTREVHEHREPDRFVAGTVGMPGERTFFLQARSGSRLTSVVCEKQQVAALADRVDDLLDEVITRGADDVAARGSGALIDNDPLDVPIVEEFRVGAMALGWDDASRRVVIEAHAASDEPTDVPDLADDEALGPDTFRIWLLPQAARSFAVRARAVVSAGRPPCPFCSQPLDPGGHVCPRANGYRRRG